MLLQVRAWTGCTSTGPCLDGLYCYRPVNGRDDSCAAVAGRYCTGPCVDGMKAVRQSLYSAGVTEAEYVQMSSDPADSDIANYLSRVQERARSESPSIWLARDQHSLVANSTPKEKWGSRSQLCFSSFVSVYMQSFRADGRFIPRVIIYWFEFHFNRGTYMYIICSDIYISHEKEFYM